METLEAASAPVKRRRYAKVNAVGLPSDKLDDREALVAARKLFILGFRLIERQRPAIPRLGIVRGRYHTWVRRGIVNPNRGWHDLVHDVSHDVIPNHSTKHEWLELQLAQHVRDSGWLEGKLRREPKPKPKVDIVNVRYQRTLAALKRWETKRRRAVTALKQLRARQRYYERKLSPTSDDIRAAV